jgi:hypothetical protein
VSTVIFGTIFSFIVIAATRNQPNKKVHAKLLSKPFIRLWNKIRGEDKMNEWIDYDEKVLYGKEKTQQQEPKKNGSLDLRMDMIPKAKLAQDSPYG